MTKPLLPCEVDWLLPPESEFEYELHRLLVALEVENHNAGFYTGLPQLNADWEKIHAATFDARAALVAFVFRHAGSA